MKIQDLAQECQKYLKTQKRVVNDETYVTCTDDAPEWFEDLCRDAHDRMLPDDWRYQFISDALDQLAEYEDHEDACSYLEPDTYNSDLLNWLASRNDRYSYVDEAVGEFGHGDSVIDDIGRGQLQEKLEVFHSVVNSLESRLEDVDQEDAV